MLKLKNTEGQTVIIVDNLCPELVVLKNATKKEKNKAMNEYADDSTYSSFGAGDVVEEENYYVNPENDQNANHNCGIVSAEKEDIADRMIELETTITGNYHDWTSGVMDYIDDNKPQKTIKDLRKFAKSMKKEYGDGVAYSWEDRIESIIKDLNN